MIGRLLAVAILLLAGVAQAGPVLDRVRAANTLRCGVGGSLAGFSLPDSRGEWHGLDVDYCRALATAVLGDVLGGIVSAVTARDVYGVVLADDGRAVDHAATSRRRASA